MLPCPKHCSVLRFPVLHYLVTHNSLLLNFPKVEQIYEGGDYHKSRPPFVRGGFGRVSTSSSKSGNGCSLSIAAPSPVENYNCVEEVKTTILAKDGKQVEKKKEFYKRYSVEMF